MLSLRYENGYVVDLWQGPKPFVADQLLAGVLGGDLTSVRHTAFDMEGRHPTEALASLKTLIKNQPSQDRKRRITLILPMDQDYGLWQTLFFQVFP
jgi:hypothetical protein